MPDQDGKQPTSLIAEESAWPDQIADRLESFVGQVRKRTVVPLKTAAAVIVYGIVIAVAIAIASILFVIAAARAANGYLFPTRVWEGYLALGGIFCLLGLLLWSKRKQKD